MKIKYGHTNRLNNILTILLCCLTLINCGQTEMKQKADKIGEPKHTRVISDATNKLTDKVENLEIEYTVWGCACPNWIQLNIRYSIELLC